MKFSRKSDDGTAGLESFGTLEVLKNSVSKHF